ncbi:3-oxo-5-alpha-steroid 4-dehydrogenase [Cystoisospora suis]|uniref:3-oxo-5-alpha-steroid 4-dehydrogenase n=1 Tax=Cystoisospora suis TaxID=483139 RepID=A0A2C6KHG0_9APIC|nr:3-oxo-5-alpha-steroid 4-dehydrogenase [Cystoisospora suis]
MRLSLKKRNGKFIDAVELRDDCTVDEFKELFYKKFHYYPERQWWTVGEAKGVALKAGGLLSSYGVHDGSTLVFKDLGVQISWRLVFVLEYLGPLLIFPLFYCCPSLIYGVAAPPPKCLVQKVAFWLTMFHYVKRELETLFVHRFSSSTMPIINVPINCGHYWMLFGVMVGYFLFHPKYQPMWRDDQPILIYSLAATMTVFELLNFKTHLILRGLRARGTRQRGIPSGWGFDLVSCANYLWETLGWITFSILVSSLTSWIFTVVGFAKMTEWALKKQRNYLAEFKDYPRHRRAIIPFIL